MREFILVISIVLMSHSSLAADASLGVEGIKYYPQYSTKDGTYSGYAADVFKLFAQSSSTNLEIKPMSVKRLFRSFFEGDVDFKYPDSSYWGFSEEREKSGVTYSDPVVKYIDGCMILRENVGKGVGSIKTLGTVRGFTPFDYLDRIKSGEVTLSENSSFAGLLRQVLRKRVDCAYINVAVARYQLKTVVKKPGQLVFDPDLPHTRGAYTLSTIQYPRVIEEFNRFLADKAPQVKALKREYGVLIE